MEMTTKQRHEMALYLAAATVGTVARMQLGGSLPPDATMRMLHAAQVAAWSVR